MAASVDAAPLELLTHLHHKGENRCTLPSHVLRSECIYSHRHVQVQEAMCRAFTCSGADRPTRVAKAGQGSKVVEQSNGSQIDSEKAVHVNVLVLSLSPLKPPLPPGCGATFLVAKYESLSVAFPWLLHSSLAV